MNNEVEELKKLLWNVNDAYYGFVVAIIVYAKKKPERLRAVIDFIKSHADANSSDILEFVSNQPDFYEDADYCNIDEDNMEKSQEDDIRVINGIRFRCVGLNRENKEDDYCQCGGNEFAALYTHNMKTTYVCVKCKKGILYEL